MSQELDPDFGTTVSVGNSFHKQFPRRAFWHTCCSLFVAETNAGKSAESGNELMLNWSLTFLVVGLIAAVLGFTGLAGAASQIAWILFVVFLVLYLVSLVAGRRIGKTF